MQIYGLTETSPLLTVNRRTAEYDELPAPERARRLARAGVPAIGVRMKVDGQGEVLARSNHVFEGYWAQPEATADAIVDGWFHTGDGADLDDAYIVISDRKKDVIISGGENVSSIEVEDCLFQHPAVAEAAVIGVPDAKWGEIGLAVLVATPGSPADPDAVRGDLLQRLAAFKVPGRIEFVDELPKTATGKVRKPDLRASYVRRP
jgi:acyl-CoA synthetase (AMP-forming)/AMP-acid ligase II